MAKGKGIQSFPIGEKFPGRTDLGKDQRPFQTPVKTGKGPQVFDQGHKFGNTASNDPTRSMNPGSVATQGPQTFQPDKLGTVNSRDKSRPFNPKD